MEPKEIPSCLIPRLLVVFTRQLEILVTTLALGHIITAVYSSENRFLSLLVTRDREAEVLTASLSTEHIQTSASLSLFDGQLTIHTQLLGFHEQ